MSAPVFFAVLLAAMLHAGWNAGLKLRLEPLLAMTLLTGLAGVLALPALLVTGFPRGEAWGWLAASILLHLGYYVALSEAYRHADMSQVYPLARGSAPLLTTIGSAVLLHEPLAPSALAGVALLCAGVMLISFGAQRGTPGRRGLVFALLTALTICGYTVSDGLGARAAGDPHAYAAALFVVDAVPLPLAILVWRGPEAFRQMRGSLGIGVGGAAMSVGAYWIAIWAFSVAPIALVATLRETSVLFAMVIATVVLKEKWRPIRGAAALLIVAGIATMRLG